MFSLISYENFFGTCNCISIWNKLNVVMMMLKIIFCQKAVTSTCEKTDLGDWLKLLLLWFAKKDNDIKLKFLIWLS